MYIYIYMYYYVCYHITECNLKPSVINGFIGCKILAYSLSLNSNKISITLSTVKMLEHKKTDLYIIYIYILVQN